ncbi:MAG: CoA transferase, partial [Pseudomonadota bacterium]
KKSVAVDMRSERGKELITEIITALGEDAGMFLTNLRVRGWMDYETLSKRRRDLIMVTLLGDRHGRPAVDYTVNPSLGFPMATGPESSTDPIAHVLPAWDCIAGGMAVNALLAAERHRFRRGEGQEAVLTLKDVGAAMLGNLGIIGEVATHDGDRAKSGNALYGAYGKDFLCADGRRVMVIGLTDRQWRGLVKITGSGDAMAALAARLNVDLSQEGARWEAREEITAILAAWFSERRVADFAEDFEKAGLIWSEFKTFREAVETDPDLSPENPMFSMLSQPGLGEFAVPGSPVDFSALARQAPEPAPTLGRDTEEVLADVAGLTTRQIGALFDDGVVSGPRAGMRAAA